MKKERIIVTLRELQSRIDRLREMVEADMSPIDIFAESSSIQRALKDVNRSLLTYHLEQTFNSTAFDKTETDLIEELFKKYF